MTYDTINDEQTVAGNGLSRVERVESGGARAPRAQSVGAPSLRSGTSIHNKVQLWAGGPYWAETNIGAENPWESGYYFWWGDAVGYNHNYTKGVWVASDGSSLPFAFNESYTPTCYKNIATLSREGWICRGEKKISFLEGLFGLREDCVLTPKHDAAHVQWGGGWRMPTKQELNELCLKCNWIWTTMNGVNGYVICGRDKYASASIFLPCAGEGDYGSLYHETIFGNYWSSVPDSDDDDYAYKLVFCSGDHCTCSWYRYSGYSVRPVQGFSK